MSGAQNAVMGEADSPLDLPQTQVPEEALTEENKRARYSRSSEFKKVKEYWEGRREFFQKYLPHGGELRFVVPDKKVAQQWVLASNIIAEIDAFLSFYDFPTEAEDARRES